jgi:hypothetical protein
MLMCPQGAAQVFPPLRVVSGGVRLWQWLWQWLWQFRLAAKGRSPASGQPRLKIDPALFEIQASTRPGRALQHMLRRDDPAHATRTVTNPCRANVSTDPDGPRLFADRQQTERAASYVRRWATHGALGRTSEGFAIHPTARHALLRYTPTLRKPEKIACHPVLRRFCSLHDSPSLPGPGIPTRPDRIGP